MSDQRERDAELEPMDGPSEPPEGEIVDAEVTEVREGEEGGKRSPGKSPLSLALVLALVGIVGVLALLGFGYNYWSSLQGSLQEMNRAIAQAEDARSALQQRLELTRKAYQEQAEAIALQKETLASQDEKLASERARLEQQSREMSDSLASVYDRVGRESTAWMASEAEYLMRVANHRLRLERDVETAIKALQAADGRLRDSGDPGWSDVRQTLAGEIASLQSVARVDRTGLSSRLAAMVGQINKLKIIGTEPAPRQESAADEPEEGGDRTLKTMLQDGWEGFKSVMVIRHHGKPVSAMLPPEQQFFVYQNLRLQLEAARMSMLRGDRILYIASLETAEQWLGDLFDTESQVARAMLGEIEQLKGIDISPALPDISASLMELRARLKSSGGDA
ncbi:MAG: uroporphyrinogen-III C-methyltransferase [Sedimenticola sp.]